MPDKSLTLEFRSEDEIEPHTQSSSWRGFTVEHSILELPVMYDFTGVNSQQHYLAYHDLILNDGELIIDGMAPLRGKDIRGKMTYIPAGREFKGWSEPGRTRNSFTTLNFNPSVVPEELEVMYSSHLQDPQVYFQNENLKSTMLKLQGLLQSNTSHSSLYIESLGLLAVLEMASAVDSLKNIFKLKRGGLSKSQVNQLKEYIKDHLTRDITLDDMAGLVQMSRFHFTRSFKESFGESPIRYINMQRVALAKMLLSKARMPISQIAANSGFGSVQRFIKVFRDFSGITPGEYRKQS